MASSRPASRLYLQTWHIVRYPRCFSPQVRCNSTGANAGFYQSPAAPPRAPRRQSGRLPSSYAVRPPRRPTTIPETIGPQLTKDELSSIYSQELLIFRYEVTSTQPIAAMNSYPRLRDVGVLSANDVCNLTRQLHTCFRLTNDASEILPHINILKEDLCEGRVPGHPLTTVHIISVLKDMEEFAAADKFWEWVACQDESICDARTYGAAIELYTYQGRGLEDAEAMFNEALERYQRTIVPAVATTTGKGVPVTLLQGIITARLLHGNWKSAYEAFDICVRLYPTLTPPRIYELFIYERPVREAYIVFLMACRAGRPPRSNVLTPLLKEIWVKTRDLRPMLRLTSNFVGAGGRPTAYHMNALLSGVFGSFPEGLESGTPEFQKALDERLELTRSLIAAFQRVKILPSDSTFNTLITVGGKLKRPELVSAGFAEMKASGVPSDVITYRVLLNTAGDLERSEVARESWELFKAARDKHSWPLDIRDFKALIKACVGARIEDYARQEIEALKLAMPFHTYRAAMDELAAATLRGPCKAEQGPKPTPKPFSSFEQLSHQIRTLADIFSSPQLKDFATSEPSEHLFTLSLEQAASDLWLPEDKLREIHSLLTPGPMSNETDVEAQGTATPSGYTVDELRFENWKAINRLLFEAELSDIRRALEKEQKMLEASKGMISDGEAVPKVRDIGYEAVWYNEELAKARIRELIEKREKGLEGWRGDELELRKTLVVRNRWRGKNGTKSLPK